MKKWFRRTQEPSPTLSYEPLLAEMRADSPMIAAPTPLAVQYTELQWRTMIIEQRQLLEAANAALDAQRVQAAKPEPASRPRRPQSPPVEQAQTASVAASVSTPDKDRTQDDLLGQLRAIRDRDDPEYPPGVLPSQAKIRDEMRIAFRKLRPLLTMLTAQDDELRVRRGA